ncbi:ankyrin repeat domain-containing protein [Terricaulis sp.]|uniref:ankyrin repeat domain-containing protein n=1 Tax=Terricaulis sp. TaxID=2768686 RepID=UPI003784EAE2
MRILAAATALALTVMPHANAQAPEARRQALALQVVDVILPRSEEPRQTDAMAGVLEGWAGRTLRFSGYGAPDLDDRQLRSSFVVGARAGIAARRDTAAEAFAQLSEANLNAVLTFYYSREGRAILQARSQHRARVTAWEQRTLAGDTTGAQPVYTPSAAERAFVTSPPGEALSAAIAALPPLSDALQTAAQASEADYCAHAACDESHHEFFRRLSVSFSPGRAQREHAMWGSTAGDLFENEDDATLARAACNGDAAGVAAAIAMGADPNAIGGEGDPDEGPTIQVTPLAWAIDCHSVAGVQALLNAGADPNLVEPLGSTPVTLAAALHSPDILRLLLARGGDANAHNHERTALEIAMRLERWLARNEHLPPERASANWQALLDSGADFNRLSPDGESLVHAAAVFHQWNRIEWLIQHGWDGDWVLLGLSIQHVERDDPPMPDEERAAAMRVREIVVAHGVHFPIPGTSEMQQNQRGFYIQPPQ